MSLFDFVGKSNASQSTDYAQNQQDLQPGKRTLVEKETATSTFHPPLRAPVQGEPNIVKDSRDALSRSDLDTGHQLEAIRKVIELASYESAAVAEQLLQLVAPFGAKYSGVARLVDARMADLAQQKKPVAVTTAPATTIPGTVSTSATPSTTGSAIATPSPLVATAGAFDWTTLIVKDKLGTHASSTISSADQAQLAAIAAGRPARLAAESARNGRKLKSKDWVPYLGNHGWMYSGDPKAASYKPTGDAVLDAGAREIFVGGVTGKSIEATQSGVVTYDGTLSIGSGWANGAAADYVHRWLAKDGAARDALLQAGFTITNDGKFAVIDETGKILVGEAARAFLRDRARGGDILDYVASVLEQPGHADLAMQAQTEKLKHDTIDAIQEPLKSALATWPTRSVAALIHLNHWLPRGGVMNKNDYTKSAGDPMKMIHVFAVNLTDYTKQANGAFVLGATGLTGSPYNGHFDRFGDELFKPVLDAITPVHMTFAQAGSEARWADHVLMVKGQVDGKAVGPQPFLDLGHRFI
ncbi:MAG: hypothetical protein QM831_12985 [Kofleriaceae bacterium]